MNYLLFLLFVWNAGCKASAQGSSNSKIIAADQVKWEALNPARGDKSPKAATLWGDRGGEVATGFLVKFIDGFSSPPHIHNVTYKGVVISGLIHNDDPSAANMWMPMGSYWTQPKGEVHITSAKGKENVAYIEIENGPYLVKPTKEAFDSGERPVNISAPNLIWLDSTHTSWLGSKMQTPPNLAFLWGKHRERQLNGTMLKLPAGFKGKIVKASGEFRAVVISGAIKHAWSPKLLVPGGYFASTGKETHQLSTKVDSTIYIRSWGSFSVE